MENLIFSEKTLRWLIDNRYLNSDNMDYITSYLRKDTRISHYSDLIKDKFIDKLMSLQESDKSEIETLLKNIEFTQEDIKYLKALQKRKTTKGTHDVGVKIGNALKDNNIIINAKNESVKEYYKRVFQCQVLGIEDVNQIEGDLWKSDNIELVLQTLPELEQIVLKNYYGLGDVDAQNIKGISKELETTNTIIQKILEKALQNLSFPKKLAQLNGKKPVTKEEIDEAKRMEEERVKKSQEYEDYDRFADYDSLFDEDEDILNI